MSFTHDQMIARRNNKVRAVMKDLAPIWLANEEFRARDEALLFNLMYVHPHHGWVSERFKYDAFNDVLYHMGQRRLAEDEALKIQEKAPYVPGEVTTRVPNEPTGRAKISTS